MKRILTTGSAGISRKQYPRSEDAGAWRRLRFSLRRAGPVPATVLGLTLLVGGVGLLVGCYGIGEWRPERPPVEETLTPEAIPDRMVRVRLFANRGLESVRLAVHFPFRITDAARQREFMASAAPLATCVVRGTGGGISLGTRSIASDEVLIVPEHDAGIVIDAGDGKAMTYRGLLRITRQGGRLALTNHVDVESYLRGVLRGELPRSFHPESFKSLAVAARTYVLYQKQITPAERDFDVLDSEGSQMYIGVRGEDAVAVEAVEQTRGELGVWHDGRQDRLFCTYYSSTCGGCSQHVNNVKRNDPNVPPLAGGVVCHDCHLSPHYRWEPVRISKKDVTARIVKRYPSVARLKRVEGLRAKELTPDGRVVRIELLGVGGTNETLYGEDFRLCIGGRTLKSTNFTMVTEAEAFVFREGKGFGHGMGLCQYGMESKARRGMKYREILAVYYPQSKVKKFY